MSAGGSGVVDLPDRSRFELTVDGAVAIAAYERDGDVLTFTHTEVPSALEGRGVGSRLIAGALADVAARGLRIVPRCPFVAHYVDAHPEVRPLLAG